MATTRRFSLADGQFIDGTPYRVVRAIDLGGMGEVYEVDHTRAGTRRAIKVARDASDPRARAAERLRQEGLALRLVDHPNVVRVFEAGVLPNGRPFIAMELLEGVTLRALLARHVRLGAHRASQLILQALDGLQAVHDQGIVHRDVKPTNLLVSSTDRLKLLDFGVAKWLRPADGCVCTSTGQILGTARYMAPEQLRGKPVDARADLYAAALVLFEAITGIHPFELSAGTSGNIVGRLHRPAPKLSECTPEPIPAALDAVLERALARDPACRFPSATVFASALRDAIEAGEPHPFLWGADPFATTRLRAATVAYSASMVSPPSTVADTATQVDTAPEPAVARRTTVPPGHGDEPAGDDRLRVLGVAASLCALVLAVTATCIASIGIWDAARMAREDGAPSRATWCFGAPR